MGTLARRDLIVTSLHELPMAVVASHSEVLEFVRAHWLFGKGIGCIDASLLVAVRLTEGSSLWTRDKCLLIIAESLGLVWSELKAS